jgi:hypothetical protein
MISGVGTSIPQPNEPWDDRHEVEMEYERTARGRSLERLLRGAGWEKDRACHCWRDSDGRRVSGDEALYFAVRLFYAEATAHEGRA